MIDVIEKGIEFSSKYRKIEHGPQDVEKQRSAGNVYFIPGGKKIEWDGMKRMKILRSRKTNTCIADDNDYEDGKFCISESKPYRNKTDDENVIEAGKVGNAIGVYENLKKGKNTLDKLKDCTDENLLLKPVKFELKKTTFYETWLENLPAEKKKKEDNLTSIENTEKIMQEDFKMKMSKGTQKMKMKKEEVLKMTSPREDDDRKDLKPPEDSVDRNEVWKPARVNYSGGKYPVRKLAWNTLGLSPQSRKIGNGTKDNIGTKVGKIKSVFEGATTDKKVRLKLTKTNLFAVQDQLNFETRASRDQPTRTVSN